MNNRYKYLKSKYPDKIPVIVKGINIDKKKYLVPNDFTISQFVYIIRKQLELKPEQGLYCMIKYGGDKGCSIIPKHSDLVSQYEKGDYLHIYFVLENTFGCNIL